MFLRMRMNHDEAATQLVERTGKRGRYMIPDPDGPACKNPAFNWARIK